MNTHHLTPDIFNLSIPVPALDIVIFTIYRDQLCVVLTDSQHPNAKKKLVLPGGIITTGETLDRAFDRILETKTGITGIYKEQLATFGDPNRDQRGHVISIVYYALVDTEVFLEHIDFMRVKLLPLSDITRDSVGYDHADIIHYARQRLEWKMEYTTIVRNILPEVFTLSQLQKMYEMVFGRLFDKRNFRKRIVGLNILQATGEKNTFDSKRPAELYKFSKEQIQDFVQMI